MTTHRLTRRTALRRMATATGALAAPFVWRAHGHAAPSKTLLHASIGAGGMALSDIRALTASPHLRLVAVADVDQERTAEVRRAFPNARIHQDWRELFDRERDLHSVNVSTPDHMHALVTMRAMRRGLHVYTQKPLTRTVHEARQLARVARERRVVSQMGIQIHAHESHRTVVATLQAGTIGKVREVHTWSNRAWADRNAAGSREPLPNRRDAVPASLNWDHWLGVAAERPYLADYYHPKVWRSRIDFGTGMFGDMACHLLDPVFTSLALTAPLTVESRGDAPNEHSWGLDGEARFVFPGTNYTAADRLPVTWYHGGRRPPVAVAALIGNRPLHAQGSIYVGTEGVLYSPYLTRPPRPVLLPEERFRDHRWAEPGAANHYLEFVEACRGNGRTSTAFDYSGPLTEAVLLGCLSTRFPRRTLEWDAATLRITNLPQANAYLRQPYRRGWEEEGLS